ncbi:C6 zinc finger domain-containing protein [Nannizzia gypsea CBS 118893]|uniref:C6 zinc finger domain-containing protein n=1 Tax=Arthroderma gypseum (strain ATCC MYA-4604 / CBS 118893) TaxID=535722 RepID=E4UV29_ARTGP|nr:C6 zinc finger domain-containing protein [Nannizzia gypsea CBS 118893]EFR01146.1 C6 zinc finger domain-containing protein [Nannizzia gypsea CBS 118893]
MIASRSQARAVSKRPHTKSRFGCYNCKSRKIKCSETKPECENCISKHLECEYPTRGARGDDYNNGATEAIRLQPNPTSFSVQDMGFFHHYLLVAHPYLPFGSDSAWVASIPLLAHQYEFVMHAILGLGASHLSVIRPHRDPITDTNAIEHRGLAINGLNRLMAKPDLNSKELDAMLAACYALTMQSGYMFDALVEFVVFIRGCSLITTKIKQKNASKSIFPLDETADLTEYFPKVTNALRINPILLQSGIESVQSLVPLLEDEVHTYFWKCLLDTLFAAQNSSEDTFQVYEKNYSAWYSLSTSQFSKFISAENTLTLILFAHHIAIETMMVPMLLSVIPERARMPEVTLYQVQWVDVIYRKLPPHLKKYVRWPVESIAHWGTEYKIFSNDVGSKLRTNFLGYVQKYNDGRITLPIHTTIPDTPR